MDIFLPRPGSPSFASVFLRGRAAVADKQSSAQHVVPTVVFVSGGAWMIGYKLWGLPLARVLSCMGVCCVLPDYRNFPQAAVTAMIADVQAAVTAVRSRAREWGGAPEAVWLVGQSAGAHLAAMVMIEQAIEAAKAEAVRLLHTTTATVAAGKGAGALPVATAEVAQTAPVLRRVIGISGPYIIADTVAAFVAKGLSGNVMAHIFEGEQYSRYSPAHQVRALSGTLQLQQQQQREQQVAAHQLAAADSSLDSRPRSSSMLHRLRRLTSDRLLDVSITLCNEAEADGAAEGGTGEGTALLQGGTAPITPPRKRSDAGVQLEAHAVLPSDLPLTPAVAALLGSPARTAPRNNSSSSAVQPLPDEHDAGFLPTASAAAPGVPAALAVGLGRILPPVTLIHGGADRAVGPDSSRSFAAALSAVGASVQLKIYTSMSHTDPILEGPFGGHATGWCCGSSSSDGGRHTASRASSYVDPLIMDIVTAIASDLSSSQQGGDTASVDLTDVQIPAAALAAMRPRVPAPLIKLARWVNPF